MTPKLSVINLTKTFLKTKSNVFNSISLHIDKGEFVSIVGPSGCGKSTLFHILAGIEEPTSGSILFNGQIQKNRKGKSGYMFQNPLLLPWRTVLENLLLGTDILHIPKKESSKYAEKLLQKFDLSEYKNEYPSILSGGMKQRIALLRTIIFHQDLLLLDEPFGALDALTRLSCQLWLLDVWQKYKSSIFFVTHDISEAILLSNRIYVFSGRPAKIIGEFKVSLPYPRKKEDLMNKKAVTLEKKLLKLLLS
jgi:ABC-type nitrate/sulfonate/bicarbonate transport system ATPase subunit